MCGNSGRKELSRWQPALGFQAPRCRRRRPRRRGPAAPPRTSRSWSPPTTGSIRSWARNGIPVRRHGMGVNLSTREVEQDLRAFDGAIPHQPYNITATRLIIHEHDGREWYEMTLDESDRFQVRVPKEHFEQSPEAYQRLWPEVYAAIKNAKE